MKYKIKKFEIEVKKKKKLFYIIKKKHAKINQLSTPIKLIFC
jgi:hypothetical protein